MFHMYQSQSIKLECEHEFFLDTYEAYMNTKKNFF
jgi:hypothetical protein